MRNRLLIAFLSLLTLLFRQRVFTMRVGLAKGLKRRYGLGFKPKFSPTEEEKLLMNMDFKGQTVYDVGAYVGIHTMFFARAVGEAGRVVAFEPNPTNFQELVQNVRLNQFNNVLALNIGLGRKDERLDLAVDPLYPTRGTVEEKRKKQLLGTKGVRTIPVEIASLDRLIPSINLPQPNFIKIDAEGFEADVLDGMMETIAACKPKLLIELHGQVPKSMGELLISKGYSIYHMELSKVLDDTNCWAISDGHLLCV